QRLKANREATLSFMGPSVAGTGALYETGPGPSRDGPTAAALCRTPPGSWPGARLSVEEAQHLVRVGAGFPFAVRHVRHGSPGPVGNARWRRRTRGPHPLVRTQSGEVAGLKPVSCQLGWWLLRKPDTNRPDFASPPASHRTGSLDGLSPCTALGRCPQY